MLPPSSDESSMMVILVPGWALLALDHGAYDALLQAVLAVKHLSLPHLYLPLVRALDNVVAHLPRLPCAQLLRFRLRSAAFGLPSLVGGKPMGMPDVLKRLSFSIYAPSLALP